MRCGTLIILLSFYIIGSAQQPKDYTFRHIDQTNGLLHNDVIGLRQDAQGFMWILTSNGLQRYDGTRFISYQGNGIPSINGMTGGAELYADHKQNELWVLKKNIINKLKFPGNHFARYDAEQLLKDTAFKFDAYTDENNNRWLLGEKGLVAVSGTINKISSAILNIYPPNLHVSNLMATDSLRKQTWLVSENGLYLFDGKTKKIFSAKHNAINHPLLPLMAAKGVIPRIIMIDSRCDYWISTWGNLFYRYSNKTGKLSSYNLLSVNKRQINKEKVDIRLLIMSIYEDNNSNIWLATENAGLLLYHRETDDFENVIVDNQNRQSIQYNFRINCITQDKDENIWLGTDKGISVFNPYRQYFKSIHHNENIPSLPKFEILNCIQANTGKILVGTWGGGISVYDDRWNFKDKIVFSNPYQSNMVWCFVQHDDGEIWAGCQHGYIHIYNPVTETVKTIRPPEMDSFTIRCMSKDDKGNIWFGLHNGKIVQWNKTQNKFYPHNDSLQSKQYSGGAVVKIFIDKAQHFWVSTANGFKEFDPAKRIYTKIFLPDEKDPTAISGISSQAIEAFDDTTLLIGTFYEGLNFFNTKTKTFSHLTTTDGLPSNSIYALKKDSDGYIWFTTDYNLYKFKPAEKKFIGYNMEPGMINSSFAGNDFYSLRNGTWLTATSTEIICFKPNDNIQNNKNTKVEIVGFKIFDNPYFIDSLLSVNQPIQLSYQQNFLTVDFAMLNFSNTLQTKYYYQLSGVNKDWVNAGTKKFASYTNLSPGKYLFSVKGENDLGTSEPTSFTMIISPPFWLTGWFISLIASGAIFLVYLFIKGREKSIKAVEAEKLKVQQLNAEQYKNKLELEQIVNYFSSSLIDKNTVDDVLWDVAKNLIGRLGFEDCMMYLWNSDKTKMIQRAGYGPKGSIEQIESRYFDASPGQGVVGYVMQTRESVLIPDTSRDPRYRVDEMQRLSEITVPIIYNDELIGVIDSEHNKKDFFTQQHEQVLSTIATLTANKIKSIESEQSLQQTKIEMLGINEKLSAAKLEALRSQMNPHFIFNCLNSIDNLIQNDEKEKATLYLAKFATLIRSILETSKNDVVPCWKDMETLQLYLELEGLRFDNKFCYEVNIAAEIMNGDYKVPPMVIQPFVENAIHHGLLNKIEPDKRLQVNVSVTNNHIHYHIEDNGVGRKKAALYKQINKPAYESMGMQITADRINLFNKDANGRVKITDLYDETNGPIGTRVEVDLINQS